MGNAGPGPDPHPPGGVGRQVEDLVVGQVAPAGEILPLVPFVGPGLVADQAVGKPQPQGPVAGQGHHARIADRQRSRNLPQRGGHAGVCQRVERAEFLWVWTQAGAFDRAQAQPRAQPAGEGSPDYVSACPDHEGRIPPLEYGVVGNGALPIRIRREGLCLSCCYAGSDC
jgi:hypothetical protein